MLVIGFPHLVNRLLFDVRTRSGEGPVIRLVPPVRKPEERFAYLRALRPGLGDPEKYVFIQWPLGLESLVSTQIWQRITDHCANAGGPEAGTACDTLLQRLRTLDRREDREAIAGRGYRALWPKPEA